MTIHEVVYFFISSFIALFPVINPIGNSFIVNGFLEGLDYNQHKIAVKKIVINCSLLGLGTLIAGHLILLLFGLAIPVIQLGGGIVICMTAWGWLSDSGSNPTDKTHKEVSKINMEDIESRLFYPISFPICLGPGSMSVIFTLMATATVKGNLLYTGIKYAIIALVIIVMFIILYFLLSQGPKITKRLGTIGNIIINKLIAFITFCIGIQIIVNGIAKIFHLNIL